MEQFLRVGVITAPHGVHGEVKVYPTTDGPDRFKKLKKVYLGNTPDSRILYIESAKSFKEFGILKFRGLNTPEEMHSFLKKELYIERADAQPLGEKEYYIADLIDMKVLLEDGSEFGVVKDVMQTGANDVYVVNSLEHGEVLIPAIDDCILDVNVEENVMKVHLLEGLLDL